MDVAYSVLLERMTPYRLISKWYHNLKILADAKTVGKKKEE